MALTPEQVEKTSDLWALIMDGEMPSEVVPFPKNKPGTIIPIGNISMKLLTAEEAAVCKKEASDKLKILNIDKDSPAQSSMYNEFLASSILFRSCRDEKNISMPIFPNKDWIQKKLTTDEIGILMNHYYTLMYKFGPVKHIASEDELKQYLMAMQAGGVADPSFLLNSFSSDLLKIFVVFLADQLKALQPQNS